MKKYLKEIIILALQMLLFYVFPLTAGPTDAMGMVLLIICGTFLLSLLLGLFSKNNIRFLYPLLISILFIPSVFIYYNESALVHALWYLVIGYAAMLPSIIILLIKTLLKHKPQKGTA